MTKSLTIINTSNWDGENYVVVTRVRGSGNICHLLKPCDKLVVLPSQEIIATYSISDENTKAFKDKDGHQVLPYVDVEMRRPNQSKRKSQEILNHIEFIFKRTNTSKIPSQVPDSPEYNEYDMYVPDGWTDEPRGVTENMQYEWACSRVGSSRNWSSFCTPRLFSKYDPNR